MVLRLTTPPPAGEKPIVPPRENKLTFVMWHGVPPPRSSLRDGQATSKVNINIRASPASQQSIKKKNSPVVVKTEKGAAPQFDVRPENFNEMVFWFAERTFNRRSMAATTTPSSLTFMLLYMAPP